MSAPDGEESELDRLRTLLLGAQTQRLAAAETSLDSLVDWVGDAPRLEAATARVLIEALRRAEIERHAELAAAVAPVVVAAIRSEILNSRDLMVEALYPITGRMVTAAVANAFRDLIEAINQRIDALVSTEQWRLRLRALASGRSVAEIALAEARGALCVRALLLERGAGRLLAQWRPGDLPADNPDLISGLIAAITEFAASVFSERRGELRALDLGASRIYVRASSRVILAAEMVGEVSPAQEKALDARFVSLVERRDRNEALGEADLADLAGAKPRARRQGGPLRWIVFAVLVAAALGLALRGPVYRWRKGVEIEAAYREALSGDARLAAYPLSLEENWSEGTVALRGLAPSRDAADRLAEAVRAAAAPLTLASALEIVASEPELTAARGETARLARALADEEKRSDALRADLTALRARSDSTPDIVARVEALASQNAAAALQAKALADRLDRQAASLAALEASVKTVQVANDEALARGQSEGTALAGRLDRAAEMQGALESRVKALAAGIETLRTDIAQDRSSLAAVAQHSAIFFTEHDVLENPEAADKTAEAIAEAIRGTGESVRVVGYADDLGGAQVNFETARLRAARIAKMLIDHGAPADKVITVGRGATSPISDSAAPRSRNRRVVFEPLYPGETP